MSWWKKEIESETIPYCCEESKATLDTFIANKNCDVETMRLHGWVIAYHPHGSIQITCPACDEKDRVYAAAVKRIIDEDFDVLVRAKVEELRKTR